MKFVVDDFGIHTIEECLLQKLPQVFSTRSVLHLSDEQIEGIAAETGESQTERASCTSKLEALQRALDVLHRLDRHKPRGKKSSTKVAIVR
jgi:hypothetical protein